MNCTYSNYAKAAVTCSAAQHYSTFAVQTLYKVYSMELNCTYSNYTEAAVTCSAAQHHSKFTVQILYILYRVQLNCTYSNYTEAATTCSAAKPHNTFTLQLLYKLYLLKLNCTYSNYTENAVSCSASYSTAHFLYKCCTNCTVCNWTALTVITQNLPLNLQLHIRRKYVKLMPSQETVSCSLILYVYLDYHIVILKRSPSRYWLPA